MQPLHGTDQFLMLVNSVPVLSYFAKTDELSQHSHCFHYQNDFLKRGRGAKFELYSNSALIRELSNSRQTSIRQPYAQQNDDRGHELKGAGHLYGWQQLSKWRAKK